MGDGKGTAAALVVTAAVLAFSAGHFAGSRSVSGDYQISVQRQAPAVTSPLPSQAVQQTAEPMAPAVVDINSADSQTLQTLPGIGPKRAESIIAYREEHGPFRIPEEITNVSGIGEGILEQIIDYITAEEVTS